MYNEVPCLRCEVSRGVSIQDGSNNAVRWIPVQVSSSRVLLPGRGKLDYLRRKDRLVHWHRSLFSWRREDEGGTYLVPNAISSTIKNRTEDWSAVFFRVELVEGKKDRDRSSFFKTLRFYWRSGAHRAFLPLILFVVYIYEWSTFWFCLGSSTSTPIEFSPIRMLRLELRFVCLQIVRVNLYRRNGMMRVVRNVIAFTREDIRVLERGSVRRWISWVWGTRTATVWARTSGFMSSAFFKWMLFLVPMT